MKEDKLLSALQHIDPSLIEEAAGTPTVKLHRSRPVWKNLIAACICAVLCLGALHFVPRVIDQIASKAYVEPEPETGYAQEPVPTEGLVAEATLTPAETELADTGSVRETASGDWNATEGTPPEASDPQNRETRHPGHTPQPPGAGDEILYNGITYLICSDPEILIGFGLPEELSGDYAGEWVTELSPFALSHTVDPETGEGYDTQILMPPEGGETASTGKEPIALYTYGPKPGESLDLVCIEGIWYVAVDEALLQP